MTPNYRLKLQKRIFDGNFRQLPYENTLIDFCSNDYLGLASNEALSNKIEKAYLELPQNKKNGATGSRLISGNSNLSDELEEKLARIFLSEKTLLFNSGYAANIGMLSALPQKGDTILYDEQSHASIKDGIRLSFADRFSFKHNDLEDLEKKIKKSKGHVFVVAESIYSMDGDFAPLQSLVELCKKSQSYLIIDEAHTTGIFGRCGNGLVCKMGLQDGVFARIHTFGKGLGSHGACVAADSHVIEFLVNFSRPFIYTTAMPAHNLTSLNCAFDFLKENHLQDRLQEKIDFFVSNTGNGNANSPIQIVHIPGNEKVKQASNVLKQAGLDVKAIMSPTVKHGSERLRICIHAFNTKDEMELLIKTLEKVC